MREVVDESDNDFMQLESWILSGDGFQFGNQSL
jgi:hypothetical protein